MEIKILQVFYDKNGLPYKDKERTVHYPITSGTFLGASNTTQIRFYYDELDELNESTFVAVSKLPNGKIGSEILESAFDEELNENYVTLSLSQFYTQYKGDVYISLQGYQGGVRVEQDENGIYSIIGTPTIQATGSIKLSIAYAPTFVGSGQTENVTLQRVLAELSTKLGIRQETLHVEELPTVGNPNVWYVVNDDPNDTTKANIYVWNENTRHYIWVGDNTLDLGEYYTKEQGEQFESGIDNRVTSVESELSSVASGSPKGVYATLSDLQTAYPTGTTGIYVVQADGHWYYWNGSAWTDGGVYLSTVNAVPQTDLNVQSYRGAYIGSGLNIFYERSGQNIKLFIYGTIAVVINNNMYAVTLAQVNADNPNSTTLNNNILEVTLNAGNSLVYDITDGKIKIVSQFGITNTQIILIKTSANQINGGVLYTKLLEKCLETNLTKYISQFYDISNFFKIEETLGTYVYFYASQLIGRVGPTGEYTMSQLATQLGVSLFTSPSGIENCLRIDNTYSLVYNIVSNQYQIIERTQVSKYHIILLSNVAGKVVEGELISQSTKYRDWYEKVMQIYNAGDQYPYIECDRKNAKIYFSYGNIFVSRVLPSVAQINRTCAELATQLGVSLVTSPNGHENCIEIDETIALTFNIINGKQRLVSRDSVTINEIILISNIRGKIVNGLFKDYTVEYSNNSDIHNYIQEYPKGSAFITLFNDSEENDSYLFFTDPHTTTTEQAFAKLLGYISKYDACIPFDFVLCGGDWLRDNDSLLNAKYKLGYITSEFNKNIKNYHQILGNHDNNYQGVAELSKQELINIYNRENGSNYYSFTTKNTTYYCLDTGSDWDATMNTYRWEQINWLANKLLSDDAKHSVIAMHIYWNDITNYNLSQMATNLNSLIIAYNTRTSISLNGISYDFSSMNGHIEYVICGHIHGDKNAKIGTIPVFSTYNAWDSSDMTITFDMLFADYDNRTLYLVREGKGSNRTFDLDTGDLI